MFDKAMAYVRKQLFRQQLRVAEGVHLSKHPQAGLTIGRTNITAWGDRSPMVEGAVTIQARPVDPETGKLGKWETVHFDPNLVVTQAQLAMAAMAIGTANSALNYIELGDPSPTAVPPDLGDVTLEQTTGQRKAVSLTQSGNIVTAEATWLTTEGNGFTYTEAGLFTGPFAAGLMFARKTFAGIFKTSSFEMRFTWLVTFLVNAQGGDCAGIALTGPSTVTGTTIYVSPAGGEQSVAATFDFVPGANLIDVFLNGQRLEPGTHYVESSAPLALPQGGGAPGVSKGVDLLFLLIPTDRVLLVHRAIQ